MMYQHAGITPLQRNYSIDVCRLALVVIAILVHCRFLSGVFPTFFIIGIEMPSRIIVPYFLCVAGYFFTKSLMRPHPIYWKPIWGIFRLYLAWTAVFYTASFFVAVLINHRPLGQFLIERIVFFFTEGSYPHLWYFPAVLYPMVIFVVVDRLFKKKGAFVLALAGILLHVVFTLCTTCYPLVSQISFFTALHSLEYFDVLRNIFGIGLPHLTLGYFVFIIENKTKNVKKSTLAGLVAAVFMLLFCEGAILYVLGQTDETRKLFMSYPAVGVCIFALLHCPAPNLSKVSWYARRLANFGIFFHPLPLMFFLIYSEASGKPISPEILFTLVALISFSVGFILIKMNNRITRIFVATEKKGEKE